MSTSNWEDAKTRSNYHFNKWHTDTDCVEHLRQVHRWMADRTTSSDRRCQTICNWGNRREGTGRENTNINVEAEENDLRQQVRIPR